MSHPLPPKKEVALALLERSSVHVHLDPRAAGVVVPPWLKRQPQLVLQVGLNMPVPIPDLRLDDGGVTCTLSFNRAPFYCVVPWSSVYAMVGDDGRGMVWPDDVPPEVAKPSQARPERQAPPPPAATLATKRAKKSAEASADAANGAADGASAKADGAKPKARRTAKKRASSEGVTASGAERRPKDRAGSKAPASDGRATLVAVPAAAKAGASRDGARDLRDRGPTGAEDSPAAKPSPSRRPSTPNRPKRELPPYLRVVK